MSGAVAGFVNAHTHIYSALAPLGMPPPVKPPRSFLQILERVWWRLDRALDARSLAASARLYAAEALLHGTTTLVDHHESPNWIEGSLDVLADACDEIGIRALLCYGATERNGGRAEAARGLAECRRFALANRRERVRGVVGLHASFTVSDETLAESSALLTELKLPCHVHVAEDMADLADARTRGARGPLERLLSANALPAGSLLAHGVHLDQTEVLTAEARGLWLTQNPRSNEGNRVGYPKALAASRRVALGTDGYPADMREEYASLVRLAREHEPRTGMEALRQRLDAGRELAAERFGAEAIATDKVEFAPSRRLRGEPPPPTIAGGDTEGSRARPAGLSGGVAASRSQVARVVVGGRTVVENGRLVNGDLEEIRARAREEAARLWKRMEAIA